MAALLRLALGMLLAAIVGASPAAAQSVRSFTNSSAAAINSSTACTSPIVRNFTVASNFIVGDVDLGVFAIHTWRGDIRITLQSPAGTRQQLVNGDDAAIGGDNFSVRLNDGGTRVVNTDDPLANHSGSAVPPYQHTFIPDAPLSVFNGQQSAGTWRLEICDLFPAADDGTFVRSDLYLTPATSSSGTGAIFVVASTADSGTATLRQAVLDANAAASEADTISFAIPGAGPHTITLSTPLPPFLGSGDTIDGTTQPGASCGDLWAGIPPTLLVRLNAGSIGTGLHLEAANLTVRGLSITGFTNKVYIHPFASNVSIRCNYIGLLPDGTRGSGTSPGVLVEGPGTVIGGLGPGDGNVISGNSFAVWTFNGSTNTAVRGNFIGTNPTGMNAIANGTAINNINGSASWRDITRNLISGNTNGGIALESDDVISPATDQIRIQRNRIGFNRTLGALLLNGTNNAAIQFAPGSITNVLIGGAASAEGNEIAGSREGILLQQVSNIRIRGNTIARSTTRGIWVENARNITIGGTAGGEGNAIGGSGSDGIYINSNSSNITILGNLIQPVTITGATFANTGEGIWIDGASGVNIGDGSAQGRNVIGGNRLRAIRLGSTNSNITIDGNYIGTNATGNVAVANGQSAAANARDAIGVQFSTVTNLTIRNNVIGGYTASLIEAFGGSSTGLVIQNNSLGVGADGVSQIVSGVIEDLLFIGGSGNHTNMLIGGGSAGQGNLVAFGGRDGIRLDATISNGQVIGNTIRNNAGDGIRLIGSSRAAIISNRIFANGLRGIDLGGNGVTANDPGDGDSGPNDLLNFPVIASASGNGANQLIYTFTLDAPAAANGYRVEFFANTAADPSGFGEGERYLGHVDITHAGGVQNFTGTLTTLETVSIGDIISATTTRRTAGGGWDITSEFSAAATASGMAQLAVAMASAPLEPAPEGPFATPGNDMVLSTTVSNVGSGSPSADSIFVVLSIASDNSFLNATSPAFGGVIGFASATPSLTFTPGTDLRFSDAASPPSSFAQCTYAPATGYDPLVRHLCLNPKGTLPPGTPDGQFTVQLRTRIH